MTGLLYLIVIAMWAIVLVPIWLKRHDQVLIEKGLREDETIGDPEQGVGLSTGLSSWRWQQREPLSPRQLAFVRRRRVVMVLFALLIASLVLSAAGKISGLWISVPLVLVAIFGFAAARNSGSLKRIGPKVSTQNESAPLTKAAMPDHRTEIISLTQSVTETRRTWQPIETPLPSYVSAEKATSYSRVIDSQKPWTGQDMLDQAELLRAQRATRIAESQKRLEEARAIAMEKARKAAIAAAASYPEVAEKRAVNE